VDWVWACDVFLSFGNVGSVDAQQNCVRGVLGKATRHERETAVGKHDEVAFI
jgi:hypothetical protein